MRTNTFPYCGRTFVCGDVVGIVDLWQARAAFDHVFKQGEAQSSASLRSFNQRPPAFIGSEPTTFMDAPLVGVPAFAPFIKSATAYITRVPIEICDSHDLAAVTMGFKFLSEAEFATTQGGTSGIGARAQRIRIFLQNLANSTPENVIDIYFDLPYYQSIGGIATGAPYIDFANSGASVGAANLNRDGVNVVTILHSIGSAMRQPNRAAAGAAFALYELPRQSNGNPWNTFLPTESAEFSENTHPLSGAGVNAAGVLELEYRAARSDAWTQGTAAATSTFSRAYSITPTPAVPSMGDSLDAGALNALNAFAASLQGIGFVGFNAIGANSGGFIYPLAGDAYRFIEQGSQGNTVIGEIPHGATRFMLLAYVKTDNGNAGTPSNQTINFILDAFNAGLDTIGTTSFASSGSNAARWYYNTGSLSAFSIPSNGQVNRAQLTIETIKSSPRAGTRTEALTYWDGCFSVMVKFF